MKLKCPECKTLNEIIIEPDGFYYDNAEYKCKCSFFLRSTALNVTEAVKELKKGLRDGRCKKEDGIKKTS